jgi:multidrug efflux system membrane fusion protein
VWLRTRSDAAEGGAAGSGKGRGKGMGTGAERVVPVKLAQAKTQDVPIWLEGLGSVAAFQQVTVRAQVDGRLDKVLFTEGQAVKAGDVLAQIDPRPFLVQLHQAEGALARDLAQQKNAKTTLARQESLHAQNLIAQQSVDNAAAQAGQAEGAIAIDRAAIESAKLNLDYARIESPIDGVTGVRQVDVGNVIHPSDASGIVVITQIDPAAIYFTVAQDELPEISRAMAAGDVPVEARSRDGETVLGMGKALVIDNQINQATATLRVKAVIPNPKRLLWPNLFVKARMLVDTLHDATVVPSVAVQRGPQGAFVYTVDHGAAKMQPVEVARTVGDLAVITKGVAPGAQVVVEGANQLRPGARVEVSK